MHDYMIEENEKVGLHDCRTNHIYYNNKVIVFEFPKGYYIPSKETGKEPERTGKSTMQCDIVDTDFDGFSVCIYRKTMFGKIVREDWTDKFIVAINSNKFEFEFVTTYRSYQHILFKGDVWFNKAPYCMECEVELHTDKIFYNWNKQ